VRGVICQAASDCSTPFRDGDRSRSRVFDEDKEQKRVVTTRYSIEEFIAIVAECVPNRYQNYIGIGRRAQ